MVHTTEVSVWTIRHCGPSTMNILSKGRESSVVSNSIVYGGISDPGQIILFEETVEPYQCISHMTNI